jgi:hypothetical protein
MEMEMDRTAVPRVLNTSVLQDGVYKQTKRDEVFAFCGIWTPSEAQAFEERLADFECVDTWEPA